MITVMEFHPHGGQPLALLDLADDSKRAVWPVIGWTVVGEVITPVVALSDRVIPWTGPFELTTDLDTGRRRARELADDREARRRQEAEIAALRSPGRKTAEPLPAAGPRPSPSPRPVGPAETGSERAAPRSA